MRLSTIRLADDVIIEIPPLRVVLFNQFDLPLTYPVLQVLLPLDGVLHAGMLFEPNKPLHIIVFGEAINETFSMFLRAAHQVIRHANVKRAVPFARQNVDIVDLVHV